MSTAIVAAWVAGWSVHRIETGSMEPEIGVDSVAVVAPVSVATIEPGDVVVFRDPVHGQRIMHRLVAVIEQDGGTFLRTRGDANPVDDPWLVPANRLESRLVFDLPRLGRALEVLQPPWSYALLVGTPLLVGVLGELRRRRRPGATVVPDPDPIARNWTPIPVTPPSQVRTGVRAVTLGRFTVGAAIAVGLSIGASRARRW